MKSPRTSPILAAAAFPGGQSRLETGCGQNCPPHDSREKVAE
jgi:hypothetical protein